MDYQLVILADKKVLMAIDIDEDGNCEAVSIDGNDSMNYSGKEDIEKFAQYICEEYNVDEIEELEAGGTIINCGAETDNVIGLLEVFNDLKGIDAIDIKKLLPIIAQNRGLLQHGSKTIFKVMDNYYSVKCDNDGVATAGKNKRTDEAVELDGSDFTFLYFYKASNVVSKAEIEEYEKKLADVQAEADDRVAAAEQAAEAEIAAIEAKYADILAKHEECKKLVGVLEKKKYATVEKKNDLKNLNVGDIIDFGKYFIENDEEMQPLEWRVLEINYNKALIITTKWIECIDEGGKKVSYKESKTKKWINGYFFNNSFNEKEKNRITKNRITKNINLFNIVYNINKGDDKIFILGEWEKDEYLFTNKQIDCGATKHAKDCGADEKNIQFINGIPMLGELSDKVNIRPCMWINLDDKVDLLRV